MNSMSNSDVYINQIMNGLFFNKLANVTSHCQIGCSFVGLLWETKHKFLEKQTYVFYGLTIVQIKYIMASKPKHESF